MVTTIVMVMRRTSTGGGGGPTQVGIVHYSTTGRHSVSIESIMYYVLCRC